MSNKSIRMLISVSLNVLIIVLGIYLVFIAGSRAYSFGEKVFNEQSIDSEDNARTVEITITTDIQPKKLAELHKCSEGFITNLHMKPRVGWFTWINVFETRKDEILDFKYRIQKKSNKSQFDKLYLSCLNEEIENLISGNEETNNTKNSEKLNEEIVNEM